MCAGSQCEVCEAHIGRRPSGAIAGELGLCDSAAGPSCEASEAQTDGTSSLSRISPLF